MRCVRHRDERGNNVIHIAAANKGTTAFLRAVLEETYPNLQLQNNKGQTALMLASYYTPFEGLPKVQMLLAAGARTDSVDYQGSSALLYSAMRDCDGAAEIAAELLQYGADVNLVNGFALTPLVVAATTTEFCTGCRHRRRLVRTLLKSGAVLPHKDEEWNRIMKQLIHRSPKLAENKVAVEPGRSAFSFCLTHWPLLGLYVQKHLRYAQRQLEFEMEELEHGTAVCKEKLVSSELAPNGNGNLMHVPYCQLLPALTRFRDFCEAHGLFNEAVLRDYKELEARIPIMEGRAHRFKRRRRSSKREK
jgi:hypothetical protein